MTGSSPGAHHAGSSPGAHHAGPVRRALVTGASAGIGRALAVGLGHRGVEVVAVARRGDRLKQLADELPVATEVLVADLTDADGRWQVEQRLAGSEDPVDLLVNNAGCGAYGWFHELDAGRQAAMVELNCTAVVALTRAALPGLVARGRGGVINMGSTSGLRPGPFGAVYGATKAFVGSFTEALYEEYRRQGIHVMLALPGFTPTEFQHLAGVDVPWVPSFAVTSADRVAAAILRDFAAGKPVSVPGAANKAVTALAEVTPNAVSRRVAGAVLARVRADR